MYLVGVDIGGTNLKLGLIRNADIVDSITLPTNSFDLIRQIVNSINEMLDNNGLNINSISGVSVGFPGIVKNGVVLSGANLNLDNYDLQTNLINELGVPVIVKNDADMAILAESRFGAGKDSENLVMLTLGTGVGGAIMIDGKLYEGNGGAGELGHMVMCHNGLKCNCGQSGCIEKYVSCLALSNQAKTILEKYNGNSIIKYSESIQASEIMRAYNEGDECAKEIVDEYLEYLISAVLGYANIFRPDKIIIGGGITYAPELIKMLALECKNRNYGYRGAPSVEIVQAELGNKAGILGAVAIF